MGGMTHPDNEATPAAAAAPDAAAAAGLQERLARLEAEQGALAQELRALRTLVERVVEHRQKSHSDLVLLLTRLASKLPVSDVGVLIAALLEHQTHVAETCAALLKGKAEVVLPPPAVLQALEQTKRDLAAAVQRAVEELIRLETPLETDLLRALSGQPDLFFSPAGVRATRCFLKGQVPRERIVREFGEAALAFFNDQTTDPKLNPRPKPEEIALGFKDDFEARLGQDTTLPADRREALRTLYERVQRSRAPTPAARAQRNAFTRLSFLLELLHYYQHQHTEAPDLVFAQRLPALLEQLALAHGAEGLEADGIAQAEALLALVAHPDHRLMVINNVGKAGGAARTLKYILRFRATPADAPDAIVSEFVRHLLPAPLQRPPPPGEVAGLLRLIPPAAQRAVVKGLWHSDRLPKDQAEALARAVGKELGLSGLEEAPAPAPLPPETERQMAWERIKDLIRRRAEPGVIAAAVRDRLQARYDAEEVRQSWLTLLEAEVMTLIRVICQLPYRADGTTDPLARPILESYINRLLHEKYAAVYHKVVNSLRHVFHAKPDSPTLLNFLALAGWVNPAAAEQLRRDIGMPPAGH